ncbi:MAG TPA: alpha/beta fold hydrolase [Nocardioides sp.]|uniref:alpha/beta fold hydrolase n=1 Tax=Nocardioides sp. TaxID=35761 RepID=UPI002F3F3CB2
MTVETTVAPPLVLVHSPLVGPSTWRPVAELLRRAGRSAELADLTETVSGDPPYVPRQVAAVLDSVAGRDADPRVPVVLVAHSGAGPLLGAVGEALGEVAGYVFVDAGLPTPGRSTLATAPPEFADLLHEMESEGVLPPWALWWGEDGLAELLPDPEQRDRFAAECRPLPLAMFEEEHPAAPHWPDAPCAYLRLSTAYADAAAEARRRGWPCTELDAHHLAMLTQPEQVVDVLLGLLGRMTTPGRPG